jgi:PKD domain
MRRLLALLVALPAALALGGCERLCAPNAAGEKVGVFCPESEDNPLNDRPQAGFVLSYPPAGEDAEPERLPRADTVETGRAVIVRSTSGDRDGDDLFLEWDLDGDGRFERSGYESAVRSVDTIFRRAGSRRIKLRVTDFPTELGAPGEATVTREVHAVDRAANRPPRAAISVSPNPALAGEEVVFDASTSTDPDFYDAGKLTATWEVNNPGLLSFNDSFGGLIARRRYFTEGSRGVKVTVRDFFGAEHTAEVRLEVVTGHPGNRPPVARLVAIPNPVEAGQARTYDASASSDPDGDVLTYRWDTNGDDRLDPFVTTGDDPVEGPLMGFAAPGSYPILVEVTDSSGASDQATITHVVVPATGENLPPTARFTPTPFSPLVFDPVTLDASASSDPEGPIARYEWDLDGDRTFETDNGDDPVLVTSFDTPGERVVRLQVTDADGATGTSERPILVRTSPSALVVPGAFPSAPVAQSRRRQATELPFAARLLGTPLRDGRGERRRHGSRLSLLGVLGRGRLRARLPDPTGRGSVAERRLRRFLQARWRTRVNFGYDRRTGRRTVSGIALARARRGRGATACLRLRITQRRGEHPTGRVTLLDGGVRGAASLRFRLNRNGSATVLGRVRARTRPKRPPPRRCQRLPQRHIR